MHTGGCTDTVRESALEVDWERNPLPHWGLEPASVLRLAFQSDALPAELSRPLEQGKKMICIVSKHVRINYSCTDGMMGPAVGDGQSSDVLVLR